MSLQSKVLETESAEKSLVELSTSFAAIYTFEDKEKFEENVQELATSFFQYAATTHMIAFARKYFFDELINSGYPRLLISLVKSGLNEETENAASEAFQ